MNENATPSGTSAPLGGMSWPLIVGTLAMVVLLGWGPSRLLLDPDTYLHVAVGRWILDHHAIPFEDVFSYTRFGAPWFPHEWLSEVVYAVAYQLSGWVGPVLLASFAFAITLAYLTRYLLRYMEPVHALLLVILAAIVMTSHLLARPHVLAWPLLALWGVGLSDTAKDHQPPPWWLIAVIFGWANLHGSFTLGLALEIPFALEALLATPRAGQAAVAKRWALFMLASLLAAMATPSGWRGLWFTIKVLNLTQLGTISEWRPATPGSMPAFEIWLLLLFGLALAGKLRLSWIRVLLILGLLHLAFAHVRNVFTFVLLATIFLAPTLARQWYASAPADNKAQKLDRFFRALVPRARLWAILGSGMVIIIMAVALNQTDGYRPDASITPDRAFQAAQNAGVKGPVFNDYAFGGFLISRRVPVFIDCRADLYGDSFINAYNSATVASKDLTTVLSQYKVTWTLLTPDHATSAGLDDLPGWRRIYADDVAVVHVRDEFTAR